MSFAPFMNDPREKIRMLQNPKQQLLLGLAQGLLQSGGPSRLPVGLGQGLGAGLGQAQQNLQQLQQNQFRQQGLNQHNKQIDQQNQQHMDRLSLNKDKFKQTKSQSGLDEAYRANTLDLREKELRQSQNNQAENRGLRERQIRLAEIGLEHDLLRGGDMTNMQEKYQMLMQIPGMTAERANKIVTGVLKTTKNILGDTSVVDLSKANPGQSSSIDQGKAAVVDDFMNKLYNP